MTEVQRAAPRHRRLVWLVLGGGTLAGAALILLFEHVRRDLLAWLGRDPARVPERAGLLLLLLALLGPVPALGMGFHLWRLGSRILREERFPPSGVTVFHDTVVVRGRPALWRGRAFRLLAAALLVAALAIPL